MKYIKLFVLYFVIIITLFGLYMTHNYYKFKDFSGYSIKKLKKENIGSGDIFLVAYHKTQNLIGDLLMKVKFNHVSLAVWEGEELYFIEYANYFDKYQGLLKIPYQRWIKFNKNTTILKNTISFVGEEEKIVNRKKKDGEKIERKILEYYYHNKDNMSEFKGGWNMSWYRFLYKKNKYQPLDLNYQTTCTEIMVSLLGDSGIIKKEKALSDYHQSDFIGMSGFHLPYNINYTQDYLCSL